MGSSEHLIQNTPSLELALCKWRMCAHGANTFADALFAHSVKLGITQTNNNNIKHFVLHALSAFLHHFAS